MKNIYEPLKYAALWFFCWMSLSFSAVSDALEPDTQMCPRETVARVESGGRLILQRGQAVKLAGVMAPRFFTDSSSYSSWPYAAQAKAALADLVVGKEVRLNCKQARVDFEGELVAQLVLAESNQWVQPLLLQAGSVWAYADSDDMLLWTYFMQRESAAKPQGHGLWALASYHNQSSVGETLRPGWFQFISGTVRKTARVGGKIFLNFGADWRTDFTIEVPAAYVKKKWQGQPAFLALEGRKVAVRGFVEWSGGPKIRLTRPFQVTVIED